MLDKEELKSQVAVSSVAEEAEVAKEVEVKTVLAAPEIEQASTKEDVAAPEIQPAPAKQDVAAPEIQPVPAKEDAVSANEPAAVKIESTPEIQAQTVVEEPKKDGYHSEMNGVEIDFELQYRDRETDMKDIAKRVTEDYVKRGNDASKIGLIQVYLKPTDYTAYYVINNSYEGKIPLFE